MSENKRFLEGCEKLADGRYRIREKFYAKVIPSKEKFTEKVIVEGKEYHPTRSYEFLIWNSDFNGNGRSYAKILKRCIDENRVTWTLADHPEDGKEPDSLRICGIAKDPHMVGEWLAIRWYPINWVGDTLANGYDLGCPACLSSSIIGSLDDEGYVVNDNTLFVERWCDHLQVQPSNSLYQYTTDGHVDFLNDDYSFNTISETIKESAQKENLTILKEGNVAESTENAQNDKADETESDNSIGEEKMPENTNDELIQQSMALNIKSMIKDAESMDSPFDKKEALVSADCFAKKLADDTLHTEICKKIEETDNEIKELSAKGLQTDGLAEKVKTLEDENKKVSDELEALKAEKEEIEKKLKTVTDMYEDEQYKASESEIAKSEELEEKNHRLSKEICSLKAKNRNLEGMMRRNGKILESKMNKIEAEANTMVDADVLVACNKKIKKLEGDNAELSAKVEELEDTIASMKKANDALDAEANVEEIVSLKKMVEKLTMRNNRLRKALNEAEEEKKAKKSRFSTLKKELDEDDEVIVDDGLVNNEINDVVVDNGDVVVAEERDEDAIMEKLLSGKRS